MSDTTAASETVASDEATPSGQATASEATPSGEATASEATPSGEATPAKEAASSGGAAASGESAAPVDVADLEEAMRDVVDPELGINVVDLGLVYGIHVDAQRHVVIDMTLTSAACPLTDVIEDQTASALSGLAASHAINWVWMPPWGPEKITEEGKEQLRALSFNI